MRARPRQSVPPCVHRRRAMRVSRLAWPSATGIAPAASALDKQEQVARTGPREKILHPLRAAARIIDQKIGWNRIGLALSLAIIVSAGVVLYRILRGIDAAEVIVALKETEARD